MTPSFSFFFFSYGGGVSSTGTDLVRFETDPHLHCCKAQNSKLTPPWTKCNDEQAGCIPTFIYNNSALMSSGGGIYAAGSQVVLQGVPVEKDSQTGLPVRQGKTKFIRHHVGIVNNNAQVGGGLFLTGSTVAALGTAWVSNNKAKYDGGGIAAEKCELSMGDSVVQRNIATSRGGGVYLGRLTTVEIAATDVVHNWVEGNGGGIYVGLRSELAVRTSSISYNKGQGDGAGMYIVDTMVRIDDTTFLNNGLETGQGAGMCGSGAASIVCRHCTFEGNAIMAGGRGGALSLSGTSGALLLSSAFTHNRADIGGAVFLKDSALMTAATEATPYKGQYWTNQCTKAANCNHATTFSDNLAGLNRAEYQNAGASDGSAAGTDSATEEADPEASMYGRGGAIFASQDASMVLLDVAFVENHAVTSGGAIFAGDQSAVLAHGSTFVRNGALRMGGAGKNK